MAISLLGLKAAYDKAVKTVPDPSVENVIDAFEFLEFEAFGTTIRMALGKGHQGIHGTAYGIYRYDKERGTGGFTDVVRYSAECVNPPEGVKSEDWIKKGMPGGKCQ